jgi:hypothetical protein
MSHLQKAGGLAALGEALAYLVGFGVMATLLNPGNTRGWSTAQRLAFVLERKGLFEAWILFVAVFGGLLIVVLTAALHERLKATSADLMKVATPLGFIWAGHVLASGMVESAGLNALAKLHAQNPEQAATVWLATGPVQNGLGGYIEIVGGVWMILISTAALRSGQLTRGLGLLGLGVGTAGFLSVLPPLREGATMAFGISQILWFLWIGVHLLRRPVSG